MDGADTISMPRMINDGTDPVGVSSIVLEALKCGSGNTAYS